MLKGVVRVVTRLAAQQVSVLRRAEAGTYLPVSVQISFGSEGKKTNSKLNKIKNK